jgi:hypothetical protein
MKYNLSELSDRLDICRQGYREAVDCFERRGVRYSYVSQWEKLRWYAQVDFWVRGFVPRQAHGTLGK